MLGSTYSCEQFFSKMKFRKNKVRSQPCVIFIFKIRREGPEAKIVLPIVESNNKITTTSKSKSDFKVARVTTEEQEHFSNQL